MEALGLLLHGFAVLLTWKTLVLMMVGLVLGIFVGVLPGLGGPNGVAILLPLTFTMDPTSAIVMLSCIYWGALFGGAITSILFNIPGEAWSVATTFDGYPMAQQGRAAEALTAAFTSSFIGSLVAVLLITFLAPMISSFALKFGPPEFFAVYLLTFCSFVGLGREAKHKTVISMSLGLLLAGIGMDTVSGNLRMTFGSADLLRGINFLVAVIGLFGISEILLTMEERLALRGHAASISLRVVLGVWKDLPKYWVTLLRSSFIGAGSASPRVGRSRPPSWATISPSAFPRIPRALARAASRACSRRKRRRTPPAPRRCCRCWRSAFPAPAPPRSCSAA